MNASPLASSKFRRLEDDGDEEARIRARAAAPKREPRGCLMAIARCCCGSASIRDAAPLLESVRSGVVAPLRGSWLVRHKETGGGIRRRHELPREAFWDAGELARLVSALDEDCGLCFVVVSSRWLGDEEHADPEGHHLSIVASTTKLYLGLSGYYSRTASSKSPLAEAYHRAGLPESDVDCAILWDYASLEEPLAPLHVDGLEVEAKDAAQRGDDGEVDGISASGPPWQVDPRRRAVAASGQRAAFEWLRHPASVKWLQSIAPEAGFVGAAAHPLCELRSLVEAQAAALPNVAEKRLDLRWRTEKAMRKAYGGVEWDPSDQLMHVCASRLPPRTPDSILAQARSVHDGGDGEADWVKLIVEPYAQAFAAFSKTVIRLDYSNLGWQLHDLSVLCAALPHLTALTDLDLSGNIDLEEAGAAALGACLAGLHGSTCLISRLTLRSMGIGAEGVAELAEGLAAVPQLRVLDISGNQLKDAGASGIAEAFLSLPLASRKLETLLLSTNEIRAAGTASLGRLCALSPALTSLSLYDNLIKDEGAVALADALSSGGRHRLRSLDVRSNGLRPAGAEALKGCRIENLDCGVLIGVRSPVASRA